MNLKTLTISMLISLLLWAAAIGLCLGQEIEKPNVEPLTVPVAEPIIKPIMLEWNPVAGISTYRVAKKIPNYCYTCHMDKVDCVTVTGVTSIQIGEVVYTPTIKLDVEYVGVMSVDSDNNTSGWAFGQIQK